MWASAWTAASAWLRPRCCNIAISLLTWKHVIAVICWRCPPQAKHRPHLVTIKNGVRKETPSTKKLPDLNLWRNCKETYDFLQHTHTHTRETWIKDNAWPSAKLKAWSGFHPVESKASLGGNMQETYGKMSSIIRLSWKIWQTYEVLLNQSCCCLEISWHSSWGKKPIFSMPVGD